MTAPLPHRRGALPCLALALLALLASPPAAAAEDPLVQVGAGDGFLCGLRASGRLTCWGANTRGQRGLGHDVEALDPADVPGIAGATAIAVGGQHSCALVRGGVVCFGANGSGQSDPARPGGLAGPTPIPGIADAVEVAVGPELSCARRAGGAVSCWGKLAVLAGSGATGPVEVPLGAPVTDVVAGYGWVCGIDAGGRVACAGDAPPVAGEPAAALVRIDDGLCLATPDGAVRCPELREGAGPALAPVPGLPAARRLAAWGGHLCVTDGAQRLSCRDLRPRRASPAEPLLAFPAGSDEDPWVGVAAGTVRCGLRRSGALWCVGPGRWGELRTDRPWMALTPAPLDAPKGVRELAVGPSLCCAADDGALRCWGAPSRGGGATGVRALLPPAEAPEDAIVDISGTENTGCAVRAGGAVLCWGALLEPFGYEPRPVAGIDDAVRVAAGRGHACVLRRGGEVACFGQNADGQVGDGSRRARATPRTVLRGATAIAVTERRSTTPAPRTATTASRAGGRSPPGPSRPRPSPPPRSPCWCPCPDGLRQGWSSRAPLPAK